MSQAILGEHPDAPEELSGLDGGRFFYPKNHPERAEVIDGAIGELSAFHEAFGDYAQGVGGANGDPPRGLGRSVDRGARRRNARRDREIHDLAVSKLVAGRPKDLSFVAALARNGLIAKWKIWERLEATALVPSSARLRSPGVALRCRGVEWASWRGPGG